MAFAPSVRRAAPARPVSDVSTSDSTLPRPTGLQPFTFSSLRRASANAVDHRNTGPTPADTMVTEGTQRDASKPSSTIDSTLSKADTGAAQRSAVSAYLTEPGYKALSAPKPKAAPPVPSVDTKWLPRYFTALVESAKYSWLTLGEANAFLQEGAQMAVKLIYDAVGPVGPPIRPEPGSLFIVDERRLPNWRNDGYLYAQMAASSGVDAGAPSESLVFTQPAVTELGLRLPATRQLLVLEWDNVCGYAKMKVPAPVTPPLANLQRRALRLPRSDAAAATSGLHGTTAHTVPTTYFGCIWLVQYLQDDRPPLYGARGEVLREAAPSTTKQDSHSNTHTQSHQKSPQQRDHTQATYTGLDDVYGSLNDSALSIGKTAMQARSTNSSPTRNALSTPPHAGRYAYDEKGALVHDDEASVSSGGEEPSAESPIFVKKQSPPRPEVPTTAATAAQHTENADAPTTLAAQVLTEDQRAYANVRKSHLQLLNNGISTDISDAGLRGSIPILRNEPLVRANVVMNPMPAEHLIPRSLVQAGEQDKLVSTGRPNAVFDPMPGERIIPKTLVQAGEQDGLVCSRSATSIDHLTAVELPPSPQPVQTMPQHNVERSPYGTAEFNGAVMQNGSDRDDVVTAPLPSASRLSSRDPVFEPLEEKETISTSGLNVPRDVLEIQGSRQGLRRGFIVEQLVSSSIAPPIHDTDSSMGTMPRGATTKEAMQHHVAADGLVHRASRTSSANELHMVSLPAQVHIAPVAVPEAQYLAQVSQTATAMASGEATAKSPIFPAIIECGERDTEGLAPIRLLDVTATASNESTQSKLGARLANHPVLSSLSVQSVHHTGEPRRAAAHVDRDSTMLPPRPGGSGAIRGAHSALHQSMASASDMVSRVSRDQTLIDARLSHTKSKAGTKSKQVRKREASSSASSDSSRSSTSVPSRSRSRSRGKARHRSSRRRRRSASTTQSSSESSSSRSSEPRRRRKAEKLDAKQKSRKDRKTVALLKALTTALSGADSSSLPRTKDDQTSLMAKLLQMQQLQQQQSASITAAAINALQGLVTSKSQNQVQQLTARPTVVAHSQAIATGIQSSLQAEANLLLSQHGNILKRKPAETLGYTSLSHPRKRSLSRPSYEGPPSLLEPAHSHAVRQDLGSKPLPFASFDQSASSSTFEATGVMRGGVGQGSHTQAVGNFSPYGPYGPPVPGDHSALAISFNSDHASASPKWAADTRVDDSNVADPDDAAEAFRKRMLELTKPQPQANQQLVDEPSPQKVTPRVQAVAPSPPIRPAPSTSPMLPKFNETASPRDASEWRPQSRDNIGFSSPVTSLAPATTSFHVHGLEGCLLEPDGRFGAFADPIIRASLGALVRGWRVRCFMRCRRIAGMVTAIQDTVKLIREMEGAPKGEASADDGFLTSLQAQYRGQVGDLIAGMGHGDDGQIMVALSTFLRPALKKSKGAVLPPGANRTPEASATNDTTVRARAAARKSRLKGGALGRAVIEKYSKTGKNEPSTADLPVAEAAVAPVAEKPWSKKRAESKQMAVTLTDPAPSGAPTTVVAPPVKPRRNGSTLPVEWGADLQPFGRWRLLLQVVEARQLPAAAVNPHILAAGPGMKAQIDDASAFASADPEARITTVSVSLEQLGAGDKIKALTKKQRTQPSRPSLAPEFNETFTFPLPLSFGSEHSTNPWEWGALSLCAEVTDTDRFTREPDLGLARVRFSDVTETTQMKWCSLSSRSGGERAKGQICLKYKFVPPDASLYEEEKSKATAIAKHSATATLDVEEPRAPATERMLPKGNIPMRPEAPARSEPAKLPSSAAQGKAFLKKRSYTPKPQQLDWSKVKAKTVSRVDEHLLRHPQQGQGKSVVKVMKLSEMMGDSLEYKLEDDTPVAPFGRTSHKMSNADLEEVSRRPAYRKYAELSEVNQILAAAASTVSTHIPTAQKTTRTDSSKPLPSLSRDGGRTTEDEHYDDTAPAMLINVAMGSGYGHTEDRYPSALRPKAAATISEPLREEVWTIQLPARPSLDRSPAPPAAGSLTEAAIRAAQQDRAFEAAAARFQSQLQEKIDLLERFKGAPSTSP